MIIPLRSKEALWILDANYIVHGSSSTYVERKITLHQLGAQNSREHPNIRGDTLQNYLGARVLRFSTHTRVTSFIASKLQITQTSLPIYY